MSKPQGKCDCGRKLIADEVRCPNCEDQRQAAVKQSSVAAFVCLTVFFTVVSFVTGGKVNLKA